MVLRGRSCNVVRPPSRPPRRRLMYRPARSNRPFVDRPGATALRLAPLLAAAVFAASAGAQTLSPRRHPFWALDMVVEVMEPYEWHSFGRLRSVMTGLAQAGHACTAEAYERGVVIACRTGEERLLIDLAAAPTRHPEALVVEEIRPKGPDGTPLPAREHIAFMNALLGRTAR